MYIKVEHGQFVSNLDFWFFEFFYKFVTDKNGINCNLRVLSFFLQERVCEDSSSAEIAVTEIASAMSEVTFIVEEMKSLPDDEFNDSDNFGDNQISTSATHMPTTLEELKDLLSNFINNNNKKINYLKILFDTMD